MEAVLFQPMKNKIFRMLSTENRIDVEFGHIGNMEERNKNEKYCLCND